MHSSNMHTAIKWRDRERERAGLGTIPKCLSFHTVNHLAAFLLLFFFCPTISYHSRFANNLQRQTFSFTTSDKRQRQRQRKRQPKEINRRNFKTDVRKKNPINCIQVVKSAKDSTKNENKKKPK